jgi:hypothetical protein
MASMIAVRRAAALTAMLALAAGGCGTTATITNRDGTRYEVEIVRSTPSELIVATRAGERPIARDRIRDIDHPGNVAVLAGSVLLTAGVVSLLGFHRCESSASSDFCIGSIGGVGLAASGLGMVVWGAHAWTTSVGAAGGQQVGPLARLAPAIIGPSSRPHLGAALAFSF